MDGTTAYHLVTGEPDALNQLLHALPKVFGKIMDESKESGIDKTNLITNVYIDQSIKQSLPARSALIGDGR